MTHRHLLGQGQRRVLGIQDKSSVYRGEVPSEQGTAAVTPVAEPTPPAQQFVGTLTATELEELKPWLLAVTLGSTGNTDLAAGYLAADVIKIHDDDDSHELSFVWNEAETGANRTLNLLVHAGNRTIDLYESLKVLDGQDIELHASGGEKAQLAIDTQNAERTLDLSGNLTVEANSIINQDLSSDASPTFANVSLGTGELTTGSINRASGTLTLEIAGSTILSIASADVTLANGISLNLQEALTFTGATTENLIEMPDNLPVALDFTEASNSYFRFITDDDDPSMLFSKHVRLIHTATAADDHALELDVNAANWGDIKALDINYITGTIAAGQDEGIILINIDQSAATGGDIFALEVLATEADGSTGVYGLKAGALVGPVHQDSGTFTDMDSALVKAVNSLTEFITSDPAGANNVEMFSDNGDTVTIGDAAKFEELEFLLETVASGGGIKPTFHFSTGAAAWTAFTPVDGTDGMRRTGVIAWDDADIPTWAVSGGEYLIRITRTRNVLTTPPVEDKVQISAVTEYLWDENGDVSIRGLTLAGNLVLAANSITGTSVDLNNAELQQLSLIGATTISAAQWGYLGGATANGGALIDAADYAAMMVLLSGEAGAAFSFNSQNLTSVGTIGCGTVTTTGDYLLANGNYVGISAAERLEFYSAGYAAFMGCNIGIGTTAGLIAPLTAMALTATTTAPLLYLRQGAGSPDYGYLFNVDNQTTSNLFLNRVGVNDVVGITVLTITPAGDVDISAHNGATVGLELGGALVAKTAAQINAAPHDFTTLNAIIAAADAAIVVNDQQISDIKSLAFNDGGATVTQIKDEDDMASDSATMGVTQQSSKAYADTYKANKTTANWTKTIAASGGDYTTWAAMIAAMPDLIAHAATVTIEAGTTLTELCLLKNKHGLTSAAAITAQAEKYFPASGAIPTADSATATTLRDAALAAAALGNNYFNGCWVFIVDVGTSAITGVTVGGAGAGEFKVAGDLTARYLDGDVLIVKGSTNNDGYYTISAGGSAHAGGTTTIPVDEAVAAVADGTVQTQGVLENGFVPITDYVDATGDVVVANWPAAQPMVGDRYIIVGALISGAVYGFAVFENTLPITFKGIGVTGSSQYGYAIENVLRFTMSYCGIYQSGRDGIFARGISVGYIGYSGIVDNNTGNTSSMGGITARGNPYVHIQGCAISDNLRRGIYAIYSGFSLVEGCFGDGNGAWGAYALSSAQLLLAGSECSGTSGNHADEGTADTAADDQAAAYT